MPPTAPAASKRPRTRARAAVEPSARSPTTAAPVEAPNARPLRRANPTRRARPPEYDTRPTGVPRHPQDTHSKVRRAAPPLPTPTEPAPGNGRAKPASKLRKSQGRQQASRRSKPGQSAPPAKGRARPRPALPRTRPAPRRRTGPRSKAAKLVPIQPLTPGRPHAEGNSKTKGAAHPEETPQRVTPPDRGIRPWLESVRPLSPDRAQRDQAPYTTPPIPDTPSHLDQDMDLSSTSYNNNGETSTIRGKRNYAVKASYQKLRFRCVDLHETVDPNLTTLRDSLRELRPKQPICNVEELKEFADEFAKTPAEDPAEKGLSFVDRFSLCFDKRRYQSDYPIINPVYFRRMVKKCLSRNEAVLQRTIMMSIFHQYWIGENFDWTAEGQWSQPPATRLPTSGRDEITLPKPDLAISFTLSSLTKCEVDSDPFPLDIERCLSPDGASDDGQRCFPFLFMEVKRAAADLKDAFIANLHNASQALFNIYQWMMRAGMETEFLETVRVFSFVFNAQELTVRVHRAERGGDGKLIFRFAELFRSLEYDRDSSCQMCNSILKRYAARELHPILRTAFQKVSELERLQVVGKRKAGEPANTVSKRSRPSQNISTSHTGQSASMSQLQA